MKMLNLQTSLSSLLVFSLILLQVVSFHECVHDKIRYKADYVKSTVLTDRRSASDFTIKWINDDNVIEQTITDSIDNYFKETLQSLDVVESESIALCNPWMEEDDDSQTVTLDTPVDLIVHVNKTELYCDSTTIAYEVTCHRASTGRPYSVFMGVCNLYDVLGDDEEGLEKKYNVILHEMFHGVGFEKDSFKLFLPENRYGDSSDFLNLKAIGHLSYYYRDRKIETFVGHHAMSYGKEFFRCKNYKGVELQGSHLSEKLFHDQLMSPRLDLHLGAPKTIDSKLVLEVLRDSGWYSILGEGGEDSVFGKDAGCEFIELKCDKYYVAYKNDTYFCFDSSENCMILNHTTKIPRQYQYFTEESLGGYPGMEYCPVRKQYWKNVIEVVETRRVLKKFPTFFEKLINYVF